MKNLIQKHFKSSGLLLLTTACLAWPQNPVLADTNMSEDNFFSFVEQQEQTNPPPATIAQIRQQGKTSGEATKITDSAPAYRHKVFHYKPDTSKTMGTEMLLSELSKEVAGKVYYELNEEGQKNLVARVAVVAAVPLSDLKRETEFGRIIGEYFLTDLADRGIKVTELRMGRDINILPQTGEFILSRNIGEIANNMPALDYVVVSTFTNTKKTLILQGRLVSLKTGLIKSSWRYSLPINRELLALFYSVNQQPFTIAVKGVGQ